MDYKDLVSDCIHCRECKDNCEFLKKYEIILRNMHKGVPCKY